MFSYSLKSTAKLDFLRREDGSVAIEAMIIMPMIFWSFLTLFSIFEAFRQHSMNQKAAFTIGDVISRETTPLDASYINGSQRLLSYLTRAELNDTAIRVSSVAYDANADRFDLDWSQSRGWVANLQSSDVSAWHARLPVMVNGERVVVVETWNRYEAPFDIGLGQDEIQNFVFTRPRYAPRVCWDQCD